jgi:ribosomal-protein-alanine N-acetyltransferase
VNGLIIRPAVSSDIDALIALDHGFSTDHVWQLSYSQEAEGMSVAFREVRLPRTMQVNYPRQPERLADEWTSKSGVLIGVLEDRPIGYLTVLEGPAEDTAWITDIVIDLRYRRMGIATRLLQFAKEWCLERGLTTMFMEMQSKNYPAICLAQKANFTFAGYSDRYYPDLEIVLFFAYDLK